MLQMRKEGDFGSEVDEASSFGGIIHSVYCWKHLPSQFFVDCHISVMLE